VEKVEAFDQPAGNDIHYFLSKLITKHVSSPLGDAADELFRKLPLPPGENSHAIQEIVQKYKNGADRRSGASLFPVISISWDLYEKIERGGPPLEYQYSFHDDQKELLLSSDLKHI
jgi:hypothetical protein